MPRRLTSHGCLRKTETEPFRSEEKRPLESAEAVRRERGNRAVEPFLSQATADFYDRYLTQWSVERRQNDDALAEHAQMTGNLVARRAALCPLKKF